MSMAFVCCAPQGRLAEGMGAVARNGLRVLYCFDDDEAVLL